MDNRRKKSARSKSNSIPKYIRRSPARLDNSSILILLRGLRMKTVLAEIQALERKIASKKLTLEELQKLKKQLKEIGYSVRTKQLDIGRSVKVIDPEGKAINDGNVFTKDFLEKHQKAFDLINQYRTMLIT